MVTIAILGVLTALAAPAFSGLIANYKTSVLNIARNEAIRRSGNVVLEKNTTGPNPCANNQQWSCGVTLWVDDNRNGTRDATDPVLKDIDVPQGIAMQNMTGTGAARLIFNRWGNGGGINALHFRVLHPDFSSSNTSICVTTAGRIRIVKSLDC